MVGNGKYIVEAKENYATARFTNKRKAYKHARNITDSVNPSTTVWEEQKAGNAIIIANWRYTPEMGGRTFRAEI